MYELYEKQLSPLGLLNWEQRRLRGGDTQLRHCDTVRGAKGAVLTSMVNMLKDHEGKQIFARDI